MSGPVGLHGGGEYLAGDEPFLDALLRAADAASRRRRFAGPGPDDRDVDGHAVDVGKATIRIVILPTAAGRGAPERAAASGVRAFQRRADVGGLRTSIEVACVVDAASAADPDLASRLAAADLIHLPGGDPDLIPLTLDGSAALGAIHAAWDRGAVVAGASAGAMALAEWTWTPLGGMRGLGLVRGLAVVPHYDDVRRTTWQAGLDRLAPDELGYLGLDERTGVIAATNGAADQVWRVSGAGSAYWFARGAAMPVVARPGQTLRLSS